MSIRTFVSLVVALAVVSVGVLSYVAGMPAPAEYRVALVMLVVGAAAHGYAYRSATGATGSVSLIPFFATILLLPNWLAPAVVIVSVLALELRSKRAPIKIVFNVAQFALAVSVASLAYVGLGGVSPIDQSEFKPELVAPLVASFAAYILINRAAVSAAVGLTSATDAWSFWRRLFDIALVYDAVSLPLAYGYARAYVAFGGGWTLVLAIPLLGIRQLYRANWQLQQTSEELLQILVKAIEARDPYTSGHSQRVAHYATIIARSIGLKRKQVDRVFTAAILHDVGKIYEDFAPILRKPSSLTPEERAVIESHSERGAQLVSTVSQLEDVVPVVRHHHERWDGRGYPAQISGQAIPLGSRIIMLADTIDAMTSDRPYRPALSREVVLAELDRMSGIQFDPDITRKFLASSGCDELFAAVATYHAGTHSDSSVTLLRDRAKRFRIA
jgi:putative nucleotidyltransferase with HDIG domain